MSPSESHIMANNSPERPILNDTANNNDISSGGSNNPNATPAKFLPIIIKTGVAAALSISIVTGIANSFQLSVQEELISRIITTLLLLIVVLLVWCSGTCTTKLNRRALNVIKFILPCVIIILHVVRIILFEPPPLLSNANSNTLLMDPCESAFGTGNLSVNLTCSCGQEACSIVLPKFVPGCTAKLQYLDESLLHCDILDDSVLERTPYQPETELCFTETPTQCDPEETSMEHPRPQVNCTHITEALPNVRLESIFGIGLGDSRDGSVLVLKGKSSTGTGTYVPWYLNSIDERCKQRVNISAKVQMTWAPEKHLDLEVKSQEEILTSNTTCMSYAISAASQLHFILLTCVTWQHVIRVSSQTPSVYYAGGGIAASWLGFAYPFPSTPALSSMIPCLILYILNLVIWITLTWDTNQAQVPSRVTNRSQQSTSFTFKPTPLYLSQIYVSAWTGYLITFNSHASGANIPSEASLELDWIQNAFLLLGLVHLTPKIESYLQIYQDSPPWYSLFFLAFHIQTIVIYFGQQAWVVLIKILSVWTTAGLYILGVLYLERHTQASARPQALLVCSTLIGLGVGQCMAFYGLPTGESGYWGSTSWLIASLILCILQISWIIRNHWTKKGKFGLSRNAQNISSQPPPVTTVNISTDGGGHDNGHKTKGDRISRRQRKKEN